MIKKTIICFVLIFAAYMASVNLVLPPDYYVGESQWQENLVKAERYLYTDSISSLPTVMVGSSMTMRIGNIPDTYNMGLHGQSAIDGIKIILQKSSSPKQVLVEINTVNINEKKEFTALISNPIMNFMRSNFVGMREGKQPTVFFKTLFVNKILNISNKAEDEPNSHASNSSEDSEDTFSSYNTDENPLPEELIKINLKAYSAIPEGLEKNINTLAHYINILESRGTEIIFFEMPIHRDFCNLELPAAVRACVHKTFPPDKYNYIPNVDCNEYKTTDPLHLDLESGKKYTLFLKTALKDIENSSSGIHAQ